MEELEEQVIKDYEAHSVNGANHKVSGGKSEVPRNEGESHVK